ncbi:par-6 (partitioning defective 6) [Chamberlinius hualienensis]
MSRHNKYVPNNNSNLVEIKSKFDAEFRRFSLDRNNLPSFEDFAKLLEAFHNLMNISHNICYTDPIHGDLLPINNEDNYSRAILSAKPILRVLIQRKGESWEEMNGYGIVQKKKNFISQVLAGGSPRSRPHLSISLPEDFRQVSAIIDVDIVPETCRRVRLLKHGSDKPLGFYIRDGTSVRVTPHGLEKVPGIFISRLVPGGLAESTGLLAVNDEVLEVNGIEVAGKSLDQVTDMMVANSSNLIITVKPANQRNTSSTGAPQPFRGGGSFGKTSLASEESSQQSVPSDDDRYDQDEIRDLTGVNFLDDGEDPNSVRYQDDEEEPSLGDDHNKISDDGVVVTL